MAVDHAQHRPYLAAIADGELGLVPAETQAHVRDCEECSVELTAHQMLRARLREAAYAAPATPAWRSRLVTRRVAPLALAFAAAIAVVSLEIVNMSPDPALAAAVLVAGRQPQYHSTDATDVARWCTEQYGNRVPLVAVSGLQPEGARMDWPHDIGIATVTYQLHGQTVHISWLRKAVGTPQPAEETVNGTRMVVLRINGITAVITGTVPDSDLLKVAQEIAA
ncbi:MAG TPA: hypothetical protein VF137_01355 [Candidatus Dormibacteraeota bacterium]